MVFKLSEQVDGVDAPNVPFDKYRAYLESNKDLIPESALSLMQSENWYSGGSSSKAPYWSDLEQFTFDLNNKELKIVLRKIDYVESQFDIVLKYSGVTKLSIPDLSLKENSPIKWRYEEILHFQNPHKKDVPMFCHNIEWSNRELWSIFAEDIEAKWIHQENLSEQN